MVFEIVWYIILYIAEFYQICLQLKFVEDKTGKENLAVGLLVVLALW